MDVGRLDVHRARAKLDDYAREWEPPSAARATARRIVSELAFEDGRAPVRVVGDHPFVMEMVRAAVREQGLVMHMEPRGPKDWPPAPEWYTLVARLPVCHGPRQHVAAWGGPVVVPAHATPGDSAVVRGRESTIASVHGAGPTAGTRLARMEIID